MQSFLIFIFLFVGFEAQAEPWISNRYAQNCAGCHAPGRLNLPPVSRRCTLSCQGCHVNPNGGGLRNHYGFWNQQRWLRSFKNEKVLGHKDTPDTHDKQPYMDSKPNKDGRYPAMEFATTNSVEVDEFKYSNKYYKDWHKDADSKNHFLSRVAIGDPYRTERNFESTVGGDLRVFMLSGDLANDQKQAIFPMALDLGARFRPVREIYSAVLEARFSAGPSTPDVEQIFENGARVKSAYLMADDLMWNSYVQVGLLRPMFGNYNPDHMSLANRITGLDQTAVFKGVSLGTAPNVPFANAMVISPMLTDGYSQDSGMVLNFGGRFVTKSASVLLSYWSTDKPSQNLVGNNESKDMIALAGGGMMGNYIANTEIVSFDVTEEISGSLYKNQGMVFTLENKYRFWRENYFVFNVAYANTAKTRQKGSSQQLMAGVKSFLYPGTEVEALAVSENDDNKATSTKTDANRVQIQLHLSF